ncbi:MAG: hypothetical protein ACK4H7_02675, partial [Acidilobaceae archaeon]
VESKLSKLLSQARRHVSTSRGKVVYRDSSGEALVESMKDLMVETFINAGELSQAMEWISILEHVLVESSRLVGGSGWSLSKEFKSFMSDPRAHMRKKLFNYTFDLLSLSDYIEKSRQALTTSFKTNIRTLYQSWVLASTVYILGLEGARIVYPEHGQILLERSGKQKAGVIPPNIVLRLRDGGEASFYFEAPRPLGWEDTSDLKRVWKLYVSLRPDIMIYSGRVLNIVDLSNPETPIMRPDIIVECKELKDWHLRSRTIRGPRAKPLTAEEWMSRWIAGLWEGLGEALGVSREQLGELLTGAKGGVRVTEVDLLNMYRRTFNPNKLIVVSRFKVDATTKERLEEENITVIDEAEIGNMKAIKQVAEEVKLIAKPAREDPITGLISYLKTLGVNVNPEELEKALTELAYKRIDELIQIISEDGVEKDFNANTIKQG